MKRYAIYGAGSLGTVLGAYITKNGGQIDLINRNRAHVEGRMVLNTIPPAISLTYVTDLKSPGYSFLNDQGQGKDADHGGNAQD